MDKILAFAFESWNKGVHKIVSLTEEYQIGEHAHHYKYAVLILVILGILAVVAFIFALTLAATGTLHRWSYWSFVTCFKVVCVVALVYNCYMWFYPLTEANYYMTNAFIVTFLMMSLGIFSFALYILSKLFYTLVGICCPLPTKDHSE